MEADITARPFLLPQLMGYNVQKWLREDLQSFSKASSNHPLMWTITLHVSRSNGSYIKNRWLVYILSGGIPSNILFPKASSSAVALRSWSSCSSWSFMPNLCERIHNFHEKKEEANLAKVSTLNRCLQDWQCKASSSGSRNNPHLLLGGSTFLSVWPWWYNQKLLSQIWHQLVLYTWNLGPWGRLQMSFILPRSWTLVTKEKESLAKIKQIRINKTWRNCTWRNPRASCGRRWTLRKHEDGVHL